MAQCQSVINLIRKEESYLNLYVDIQKESSNILDSYFWLDKKETFNLKEVLLEIQTTAASAVEEYEKVVRIKNATAKEITVVRDRTDTLFKEAGYASFEDINQYVDVLSRLRTVRGEIISLKDLRYTDLPLIDSMEKTVKEKSDTLSGRCIEFLLKPEGLEPYRQKAEAQDKRVPEVEKGSEGKELAGDIDGTAGELELLIEIVSNLKIDDPTQTTEIIDRISFIYSSLNQTKSRLQKRIKELQGVESEAEFNSRMKLLNQAAVNYLGVSDSIGKCDEYLTKLMVQIEELEGKFADFDQFIMQLTEKREELYSAFESKKLALQEKQDRKAVALMKTAERIFTGLKNRLKRFKTIDEINGYFATDLMVEKVRDIVEQLTALDDSVKADDIQSRLKTLKEDGVRQLKDRLDLFVEGKDIIKFGNHVFNVNTQPLDLSIVRREDHLYFQINGTDFRQPVDSPELEELRPVWDQDTMSENGEVYRAEFLAYTILDESLRGTVPPVEALNRMEEESLIEFVREFMGPRYQEAYTKGLHDEDAARILNVLLTMHQSIDLLIYGPSARALALLYWHKGENKATKKQIKTRLKNLNQVTQFFKAADSLEKFLHLAETELETFVTETGLFTVETVPEAADYLCREMMRADHFIISAEAEEIYNAFTSQLKTRKADIQFSHSLKELSGDLHGSFCLVLEWLRAYFEEHSFHETGFAPHFSDEVAVRLLLDNYQAEHVIRTKTSRVLEDFHGNHPVLVKGKYTLSYNGFMEKLRHFRQHIVPQYHRYQELKKSVAHNFRAKLRLDEFKTRVLSSFVRSKLIDDVYLPLVGDNLAKQIGSAGEGKRTDLMGLLLLISPPGYGKTTLMEYIANRLGVTFAKINGPAIGHAVTSLTRKKRPM
ncbi:MAG: AAA family ATPase, partial [bacterium]|nr:AAA family ATPase [bacterium]